MPKKESAPRKSAMTGKPAGAMKAPRAMKAAGARKIAVVPKPALDDEDSALDLDLDLDIEEEEAPVRKAAAPRRTAAEPTRKAAAPKAASAKLVQLLNESLGWELRAQAMYAHYAAYVKGLESLSLAEHFEEEVTESLGHAKKVRGIIAALGGEAVSTRDDTEIVHTEDTSVMLEEALKTESAAAAAYQKIVPLVKDHPVFYHAIYHILKDETAAVIEVETLLGR
ncbi:MAG: hypothetical protein E6K72_13895 [Candidatus Eisenbacteria bacterium]|uniref:Ferritin-like diiron domain-containing protein n=1 Tax=Eiseniibacteriota bacterium TaxID=2212470 RepID=A0A538S8B9_UNCEI|nr:MAG: hypothetical protein E6K72_13895 [Candidatus Eisenbacteria bacterium]